MPKPRPDNAFSRAARELKVAALVQQIDADLAERGVDVEADALIVSAQVAAYSPSDWVKLGRRAKLKSDPSDETIAQVCRRFVRRAEESIDGVPESGEFLSEEVFS